MRPPTFVLQRRTPFQLSSLLVLAILFCTACIPSVNPYYTDRDVLLDPRLLGVWWAPNGEDQKWEFESSEERSYQLTVTESVGSDPKTGIFEAHLFKLKNQLFLDLTPSKVELKETQSDLVAMSLIPGHLVLRVRQMEPTLKLDFFDWDWLEKYLEKHPQALAHRKVGDNHKGIILTASTRDLQRFLLAHLKDGELFQKKEPESGFIRGTNAPASIPAPAK